MKDTGGVGWWLDARAASGYSGAEISQHEGGHDFGLCCVHPVPPGLVAASAGFALGDYFSSPSALGCRCRAAAR